MTGTPNLALPLLAAAQAQKHVTHNEALFALDALLQAAALDKDLTAPPAGPAEGDRYIVASAPTGAWAGRAGRIACWQDGAWRFYAPRAGFVVFVLDERLLYFHDGSAWAPLSAGLLALNGVGLLGIGTTADAANPFSAKLNSALWTARAAAEGGTGDLRYVMNKETAARTVSLLFQTGFSGRAEIGLAGDDRLSIKTSPDGSAWSTALSIDGGGVDFAAAASSLASAATCNIGATSGLKVTVTGSVAISSFGSRPNALRLLVFAGSATLSHNPVSLILPGAASLTTGPGDTALVASDASGNWRVWSYQRADVAPLAGLDTVTPQGRLTLASATPVLSGSVAAAGTVYYTPYLGRLVPVWSVALGAFVPRAIGELSNALANAATGNAGPAAAVAGAVYDLLVADVAGTVCLVRSPAWASAASRGAGAGTAELQRVNGILTNKQSIAIGANTVATGAGTYLGTVATDAGAATVSVLLGGTATGGSPIWCGLWNMYNRVTGAGACREATGSWVYNSATVRPTNNSTGNRATFVRGLDEDAVGVRTTQLHDQSANASGYIAIGLDSTTVAAANSTAGIGYLASTTEIGCPLTAAFDGLPGLGLHFLQALESTVAVGNNTQSNFKLLSTWRY